MRKILLVIDMQNDFIDGALGTPEAESIVDKVRAKIESFDGEVIFTRDTHKENYMETQEGKNLPVAHCIENTYGWEIRKELDDLRKTPAIDKPTFGSRELASLLEKMNGEGPIDEIALVGLCTDICVISNALTIKAFLPEVKISVDSSCCAGVTPESHERALGAMRMCQIDVI